MSAQVAKEADEPAYVRVLRALVAAESLGIRELSARCGLFRSEAQAACKSLEHRGYATKAVPSGDGRGTVGRGVVRWSATEQGRTSLAAAYGREDGN